MLAEPLTIPVGEAVLDGAYESGQAAVFDQLILGSGGQLRQPALVPAETHHAAEEQAFWLGRLEFS